MEAFATQISDNKMIIRKDKLSRRLQQLSLSNSQTSQLLRQLLPDSYTKESTFIQRLNDLILNGSMRSSPIKSSQVSPNQSPD